MFARTALSATAALAFSASLTSAQSSSSNATGLANGAFGSLSQNCQSAVSTLISSQFASCADVFGLLPVLSGSGSVVQPRQSPWLGLLFLRASPN